MPVIEDPTLSSHPFIPRDPLETLESGDFNKDVEVTDVAQAVDDVVQWKRPGHGQFAMTNDSDKLQ